MISKTISLVTTGIAALTLSATTIASGAIAQVNTAPTLAEQTLREAQQQEKSSLSIGGSNLNILQLINNINLANGKSPEKFRADQAESLDDAVTNFRNQQRREIKISIPTNP
ncbi:hypothetical protein H6F42_16115 [Pseudanabaena sp. FACHB-1998]|uniref:hypothetical protein n=1 Tax=Pseudanabaena sp. FACHB-1998 TaxID=2692858 RepID=UPI0016817E9D|nr:hypothetical protein [Pseudanabaena sp. FACHB-1998]MBD2178444.1 hypothetical protein [Pseudanabaena sp. FACHB-1998]